MSSEVHKIAVLGAGTMGTGIAQLAALSYFQVTLFDASETALANGLSKIKSSLERAAQKLTLSGADVAQALARLSTANAMVDAVKDCDLVIEAVPEDLELKRVIVKEVSNACPAHAVIATNTSSLPVSDIARAAKDPSRVLGMHFFNPPMVLKLLEIVCTDQTSADASAVARKVGERMGREIIQVKDSPGFATSRLGVVLALEAMRMVESGVASAEDIDRAMEHGYKHQMGPLRTTDLVGLDVRLAIAEHLHTTFGGEQYRPPEILRTLVKAGKLGKKTGQGFYSWT
jgi:3-hydroxybutyryl-CoA dehydrogenase